MANLHYIPIAQRIQGVLAVKTYVFRIEIVEEDDGRWSAGVPALPGCATWGYTKEEAVANIRDAAEAYMSVLKKRGREVPLDATIQVFNEPAVAVTV